MASATETDFDFNIHDTNPSPAAGQDILKSARNVLGAFQEWSDGEERERFVAAMDAIADEINSDDVPVGCRPLVNCLRDFALQAERLTNLLNDGFIAAKEIGEEVKRLEGPAPLNPLMPLESIAKLAEEGVSHEQIARMYGFVDRTENRTPMPWLVAQELKSPGSVIGEAAKGKGLIDGRDWAGDPREIDRAKKYGKDWKKLLPPPNVEPLVTERRTHSTRRSLADQIRQNINGGKAERACPETPEMLYEQNVSPEQSSLMLGPNWPLQKVAAQWAEWDKAKAARRRRQAAREAAEAAGITLPDDEEELVGAGEPAGVE